VELRQHVARQFIDDVAGSALRREIERHVMGSAGAQRREDAGQRVPAGLVAERNGLGRLMRITAGA
jgi:hypothetical protein